MITLSASSVFQSLIRSLQNVTSTGLNCCYNNGVTAFKSYKGTKNIDYSAVVQKIQTTVTQKCASSLSGFAPAINVLPQILTASPSSLFVSYDSLPTSAKNILTLISELSAKVAEDSTFVKNKNFPTKVKAITKAIRELPQADAKTLSNSYPELGSFILTNGANAAKLKNYLNYIDKDVSGTLKKKADKTKFQNLAVTMLNLVLKVGIGRFQTALSGLSSAVVPDAIKSDTVANSAIKVIAPFAVTVANKYISNSKFVPALVTLSQQGDKFAKKYPNIVTVAVSGGSLDTSMFTVPWAIIS